VHRDVAGLLDQTKGGEAARELATYGELDRSEKRALLEPIALWLHERGEGGLEVVAKELEAEIALQFRELFGDNAGCARARARLFLQLITERAGLLVEREAGIYAFAHLTFQEYLAARALADCDDYVEYSLRHLHDPWWREILLLEVGHISSQNNRRSPRTHHFALRAVRNANSPLEDVLKRDLLFVCRALGDVSPLGVDDGLRRAAFNDLIAIWQQTPYKPQRQEYLELFA